MASADTFTAIVELLKASQKQQKSTDMFIVSRLMFPLWRKQLLKSADIVLELKSGQPSWTVEILEPLTIAVCYPYISHIPWEVRRSKALLDMGRSMQGVWEKEPGAEGTLLQQL